MSLSPQQIFSFWESQGMWSGVLVIFWFTLAIFMFTCFLSSIFRKIITIVISNFDICTYYLTISHHIFQSYSVTHPWLLPKVCSHYFWHSFLSYLFLCKTYLFQLVMSICFWGITIHYNMLKLPICSWGITIHCNVLITVLGKFSLKESWLTFSQQLLVANNSLARGGIWCRHTLSMMGFPLSLFFISPKEYWDYRSVSPCLTLHGFVSSQAIFLVPT